MGQDREVARWQATITVDLTPVNKYGDVLESEGGALRFTKGIKATTLVEVAEVIENIK
jgi:hypothetical protein